MIKITTTERELTEQEIEIREKYNAPLTSELELLRSYLGVNLDIDFDRYILYPYYNAILSHVNGKLANSVASGKDEIKSLVQVVFDEFSHGADLICDLKTSELAVEVENIYNNLEGYSDERMAFSWGHVMTALCVILRLMYGYLFENEECDCCNCITTEKKCCCQNSTAEYESWVSNVYAEDDGHDTANYGRTGAPWQNSLNKYNDCYRREKDENGCACGSHCKCSCGKTK